MLLDRCAWAMTCLLIVAIPARAEDSSAAGLPSAQADALLSVGARVRLEEADGRGKTKTLTGRVLRLDEAGLLLEREGAEPLEVRRADIRRTEVSVGRRRQTGKGARIGGLVFGIPGAAFGLLLGAYCENASCREPTGKRMLVGGTVGGVTAAAIGAGLGAAIGSGFTTEKWQAQDPARFSVSVAPTRAGIGASLSFRF